MNTHTCNYSRQFGSRNNDIIGLDMITDLTQVIRFFLKIPPRCRNPCCGYSDIRAAPRAASGRSCSYDSRWLSVSKGSRKKVPSLVGCSLRGKWGEGGEGKGRITKKKNLV